MEEDIISKINGLKLGYTCSKCNTTFEIPIFPYINFEENPEYYAKVKNLDIFKVKCENCGNEEYVKYDCLIVDPVHKYFPYLFTNKNIDAFRKSVDYFVNVVLKKDQIKDWDQIQTRLVLDLNELIEKIQIFEIGLNDKAIEIIKRGLIERKLSNNKALLFDGIQNTNLEFIKVSENPEKITVNIEFYNRIIENVNSMKEEKINFDLVNQDWVLKRIE